MFDFVAAIFGAYDADTGKQLIREFYLLISKKNTKSTIAAGIMITALLLCWREDEEHLILSPTKEIADNSFKPAASMVRADDELRDLLHVQEHVRTITHRTTRASLKVVAADSETVSGKKSGRVLVDEHWLFGKKPGAEAMFTEALGGQVSRDEGWVIYLTTQSDEPPAGVFKDKLEVYRDIRDGKRTDLKKLGVLYEFPPDLVASEGYLDPDTWHIVNPNIGKSVSREWLVDKLADVREKTGGPLQQFLAKHLNVEIGLNLRSDRWAGADFWQQAARDGITLEHLIEACDVIDVGIDGGGLDDLLGFCALGRHAKTGQWLHWGRAWLHPIALQRRKSEAARYQDFERDGDLLLVKSVGDDVTEVVDLVSQIEASGKLDKVGVDPYGIGAIVQALEEIGIDSERIAGIPQGWKLTGAIKTCERKLAGGELVHGGRPLMAWCASNCRIELRGAATSITKAASGTAKIDPVMALFNAAVLLGMAPQANVIGSEYELLTV